MWFFWERLIRVVESNVNSGGRDIDVMKTQCSS
jgi:hypothetical protein